MTKHKSTTQPGLYFWAEECPGPVACFGVVSQVDGYPATEAHDDWFHHEQDADDIARMLAEGEEL